MNDSSASKKPPSMDNAIDAIDLTCVTGGHGIAKPLMWAGMAAMTPMTIQYFASGYRNYQNRRKDGASSWEALRETAKQGIVGPMFMD
jgi:hypothetical protein